MINTDTENCANLSTVKNSAYLHQVRANHYFIDKEVFIRLQTAEGRCKQDDYVEGYPRLAARPMQILMLKQQKSDRIFPIGPE